MKTKENKKGISLIVLIITIIVIIILAAVVILTLSKNNPIESAKEARFKEDVRTFQDELALTVSKQYTTAGGHRDEKITTSDFDEIKEYIPSFSEKYKDKFIIQDDELIYTNKLDDKEKEYSQNLNVKENVLKLLPDEYQQVEYLESTGTQYIYIGEVEMANLVIEMQYPNFPNGCDFIGGLDGYGNKGRLGVGIYPQTLTYHICYGDNADSISNIKADSQKHTYKINILKANNKTAELYVDGSFIYNKTAGNITHPLYFTLFAYTGWGQTTPNRFSSCRIFYFELENRIKLYPCYSTTTVTDVDGEECSAGTVGLYDTVNGKFYVNKGTGEFIAGPEVNE